MTMHEPFSAPDQIDLAAADSLITDLLALVDAGLVVVHEHVLGPARYGVASSRARVPHVRAQPRTRTPHSPSFSDQRRPEVSVGSPP
jgi:hypothetical protein